MRETYSICGYTRISVDLEEDRDNTSIENQKAIIEEYVQRTFPGSTLDLYVDRDRSGYTFEQREQYQAMRKKMLRQQYDILIVKDLSRFSRRNGQGLVELEYLRDAGIRIIAIGDNIDYPTNDDWMRIQIYFFMNEMPVTDTSKKVKNVIKRRQEDGHWICSVPYGYYFTNIKMMTFAVDPTAAEVVRTIFRLYNEGWGYKRIANWLTERKYPTPRKTEIARIEARGEISKRKAKDAWSIATVQGILDNDFYIGTLRQGKYARKKINGADIRKDADEHLIFEKNHEAIIDDRTFALLVMGWPTAQQKARPKPPRSAMEHIVHENAYRSMDGAELRAMLAQNHPNKSYEDWLRAFCARKYNSAFSREMTRSVAEYLKQFER